MDVRNPDSGIGGASLPQATADRPSAVFRIALRLLDAGARLGMARFPDPDDETGLRALGPRPSADGAEEGLRRLLRALAAESRLTGFGALALRHDLKRLLRNAAHVERVAAEAARAGTDAVPAPLFILGLPRSGTTFLHGLLAADPGNHVLRVWQTMDPRPRPASFRPETDRTVRRVERQLRMFARFAPDFPSVHPIGADSPQECSEITAHVFQSLRFDTIYRIPSYLDWLDDRGHLSAFAFHRKYLVCLQQRLPEARWVLKCPDNTFALPEILSVYPDARFVIVHRDPLRVCASVAYLTEVLRRPFLAGVDAGEIGRQVTGRWIEGARRLLSFDCAPGVPAERRINIHYADLVADPLATVRRIYRHFGFALGSEAETAMRAEVAARPGGGYREGRRYALDRFGIRPAALAEEFRAYRDHFGVGGATGLAPR